jgi:uncharacterized protein (DUF1330 family)
MSDERQDIGQRILDLCTRGDVTRPIAALNKLKFRRKALYLPGSGEMPCSGREAYYRYAVGVAPILQALGATVHLTQSYWLEERPDEWDKVFVVRYPTMNALMALGERPDYQRIVHHRTAAIADSRLLIMEFA